MYGRGGDRTSHNVLKRITAPTWETDESGAAEPWTRAHGVAVVPDDLHHVASEHSVTGSSAGEIYTVELGGGRGQYEYRIRVLANGRVRTLARIPSDGVFRK